MELTDAGAVDDPPAADGGPRRGQRRHLGPARPAVPGAGRSRAAARATASRSTRWCAAAGDAAVLGAGGFVDTPNQRLAVRARRSPIATPDDLGAHRRRVPQRRAARASATWPTWSIGYPAADRRRRHQRRPRPAADRREAARGQHARGHPRRRGGARRAASPACRASRSTPTIFRPATFIETVARQPRRTRCWSAACWWSSSWSLFLFDWRTALISLTAIPLSLVAAGAGAALARRRRINTMVLAGLVIALGEVVDDAIIDVENIVRRLRLNRAAAEPAVRRSRSCSTPRSKSAAPSSTPA